MESSPVAKRRRAALLAICFFGSGLTALVYELLWVRKLQLVFGSTTYSVTTVLAAFMAGLGLGAAISARFAFVAEGSSGLEILDISNSEDPRLLGTVLD